MEEITSIDIISALNIGNICGRIWGNFTHIPNFGFKMLITLKL